MNLPHLAQRLFNTPLALHPSKAEVIMASVMDRFGISKIESSLAMEDDWYGYDNNRGRESRSDPGYDNVLGVAVIPICGTLVQKLGSLRPYSGMTGYDGIRQAFLTAMEDPDITGICLDIDSPGGEGELFVNTVARNRGISAKVIKSTQAACFMAADGVELGLADEVCPPDAAFRNLLEKTGA